jgi:hypothetical protein
MHPGENRIRVDKSRYSASFAPRERVTPRTHCMDFAAQSLGHVGFDLEALVTGNLGASKRGVSSCIDQRQRRNCA